MKKIIVTVIALLLVLTAVSCAEKENFHPENITTQDTTAAETEKILETGNLDGYEICILNYDTSWFNWANTLMNAEEINGEIVNDAIYNRTLKTEQNFNASVKFELAGSTETVFRKTVPAGDDIYDMAMLFDASIASVLTGGLLGFWDDLDYIDSGEEHWDADAAALYNFNGRQVALSGDFSLYNYSTRHGYVFNKDMLADLNLADDPYELVRNGKWTLDKLYEIAGAAVRDVDGDGSLTKEDIFGISGSVTRHYSALIAGSDVRYVDKDAQGLLHFTVPGNDYALSVLQKIVDINTGNQIFFSGVNDIGNNDPLLFRNGHTLFTAAYMNEVSALRDMDSDIGILPAPKYNEEQENYHSLVEGGALAVILKSLSADRYENTGRLLNALAFYSREKVIPAYIEVILKSKVTRDEQSAEMIELIFNTSVNDLGTGVWSSIMKNIYTSKIFLPRSTDVASVTASIEPKANKALDDFLLAVDEQISG